MITALVLTTLATTVAPDLQAILDEMRVAQDVPGVSAVVTSGSQVLLASASGVADLESGRMINADTTLYAGSLTKIFTAVLVLRLIEDGRLSLDDPVNEIATCPPPDEACVTVRNLLTHTSGLAREGNFDYWFNARFPNRSALSEYLRETELRTTPGSSVRYSNIGYAALGLVIERTTGQRYAEALSTLVLGPLAMFATGTGHAGAGLAAGYSPADGVLPNDSRPFAGLGRRVGDRRVREYHNARAMTPAFGAFTTARDLSKLSRFLLGFGDTKILSDGMRQQLLTAQSGARGFGLRRAKYKGRSVARHGGWFAAHQAHILLDFKSGISVVVLANSDSATPGKIAEALFDEALRNAETDRR